MDLPPYLSASGLGTVVDVFVQPRAARNAFVGVHGNSLKLKIQAPPVDNRANRAVESLLAEALGVPLSRVAVVSGGSSRHKRVEVSGLAPTAVAARLAHVG